MISFYWNVTCLILGGHNFGASVVAAVADRSAKRVAKLIFLDGYLTREGTDPKQLAGAAMERRLADT